MAIKYSLTHWDDNWHWGGEGGKSRWKQRQRHRQRRHLLYFIFQREKRKRREEDLIIYQAALVIENTQTAQRHKKSRTWRNETRQSNTEKRIEVYNICMNPANNVPTSATTKHKSTIHQHHYHQLTTYITSVPLSLRYQTPSTPCLLDCLPRDWLFVLNK